MTTESTASGSSSWRDLYPYESHYAVMPGGHRLHYVDEGVGKPVILLHGNPTWSFLYRELIADLSSSCRVIAVDNMGCGLSDKPQDYPYHLQDHVNNLQHLVEDVLGFAEVSLVVHDWGGAIGMGYAVERAERIDRLVIMNTAAFLPNDFPWRIRACRLPLFGSIAVRGFNGFVKAALTMAMPKGQPLEGAVREGYMYPYDSYHNRIATLRFVQDIPCSPAHPTWETLGNIQKHLHLLEEKPILICWGDQDFCFTQDYLKIWQQYFPRAEVHHFADAAHYLLETAGDRINPLIADFLNRPAAT